MTAPDLADLDEREPWREHAACRGTNVGLFFPPRGDAREVQAAKRVCAGCPVREECLAAHLGERWGVWGGTTERERRRLRRETAA